MKRVKLTRKYTETDQASEIPPLSLVLGRTFHQTELDTTIKSKDPTRPIHAASGWGRIPFVTI